MQSLNDAVKGIVSIVPAVYAADAAGAGVDTLGFTSGQLVLATGVVDHDDGDETYSVKIEESSDNSVFTPVDALAATLTVANQIATIAVEGLGTGRQRFLRAKVHIAGTTPSIGLSAVLNLGHAFNEPVA